MSENVGIAIIAAVPPTVAALIAAFLAWRAAIHANAANAQVVVTKKGMFELGKRLDGRLSELLASEKAKSNAEGRAEGAELEQRRSAQERDRAKESRSEGRDTAPKS